jgi:hypothetical protein
LNAASHWQIGFVVLSVHARKLWNAQFDRECDDSRNVQGTQATALLLEVMLVCARKYAAYLLSFRRLEEMMQERDVCVDHSTGLR